MGLLDGHRAIVTGGGSGIGRATCMRMAREGAAVAVLDLDGDAAEVVAKEIDGHAFQVDVSQGEELARTVADAARALGGLSIMFNNAGVGSFSPLHRYSFEEWDRVVRVNLYGVFHGIRAAA